VKLSALIGPCKKRKGTKREENMVFKGRDGIT